MRISPTVAMAAMGLAAVCAGGCATGDLTIDVTAGSEMRSMTYHLDPGGLLTVTDGGGAVEGAPARVFYKNQLDANAMSLVKRTITSSGFFIEEPSTSTPTGGGVVVALEVHLGIWENRVSVMGQRVTSMEKILGVLNRYLDEKHKIPYPMPVRDEADAKILELGR